MAILPFSGGSGLSQSSADARYVKKTGDTMSGDLSFSGTQKILGGTATTSALTLQTTSGVGATGADFHLKIGNNGATDGFTVLNSGFTGFGGEPNPLRKIVFRVDNAGSATGWANYNANTTNGNDFVISWRTDLSGAVPQSFVSLFNWRVNFIDHDSTTLSRNVVYEYPGNEIMRFDPNGNVWIGHAFGTNTDIAGAVFQVNAKSASTIPQVIKAFASQNVDLMRFIDSSSTTLASFGATGNFVAAASTTSKASINLPSGTAPTSPTNGDIWYDGTHIQGQVNGATSQLDNTSAIGILSTTTGINAKSTGTTTLYTVPTGKTAIITGAIVRCTAASSITNGPTLGIGIATNEDDIYASTNLVALKTTTNTFGFTTVGMSRNAVATSVVKLGIDTIATGTSQTVAIDLIGYTI